MSDAVQAQTLLDAVNQVIQLRLAGDAYIEYTATTQRFRGETLEALFKIRNQLQNEINSQNGQAFGLAYPFWE